MCEFAEARASFGGPTITVGEHIRRLDSSVPTHRLERHLALLQQLDQVGPRNVQDIRSLLRGEPLMHRYKRHSITGTDKSQHLHEQFGQRTVQRNQDDLITVEDLQAHLAIASSHLRGEDLSKLIGITSFRFVRQPPTERLAVARRQGHGCVSG